MGSSKISELQIFCVDAARASHVMAFDQIQDLKAPNPVEVQGLLP